MPNRTFEDRPATRERVPLLLGIVGPSSSGKTFSALRLAAGMQRVIGGEVFFVDTEGRRALHYADRFKFRHVAFDAPFGPLDYLTAIEHCLAKGAKVLVIDSMTHEHSGPGGVMDQSEKFLEDRCGDDWKKREKMLMLSLVRPKSQRKKLNAAIVRLGVNAIFCYRADEKIKPVTGGEPQKLGWQPETTSKLHYEMTQRFLLTPGCDGVPSLTPETDAERRMVKNPVQFRNLIKPGEPLSEDLGQKLAEWAAGSAAKKPTIDEVFKLYRTLATREQFAEAEKLRALVWNEMNRQAQKEMKEASAAAAKRLPPEQPAEGHVPGVDEDPPGGEPGALFDDRAGVPH